MRHLISLRSVASHPIFFVACASVFNSIWFNLPLLKYLWKHLDFGADASWITALLVWLLPTVLSAVFFSILSLFSNGLLKAFMMLCFLANAMALYFIAQYGVVLDRTMMGNVFNTNSQEVSALLDPWMLVHILGWAGVPMALAYAWPLRVVPWWHKALGAVAPLVAYVGLLYIFSFTWLWFDRHASQVGSRVLPWSYVVNSVRHFQQEKEDRRQFPPLPDAVTTPLNGEKRVLVLVIGESARADRFSMLGYHRDTNAETRSLGVVAVPGVTSCASYTLAALNCILSHRGDDAPTRSEMGEPLPTFLLRQGVSVIWRSANSGQPPIATSLFETRADIKKYCPGEVCPRDSWDEVLLEGLPELIRKAQSDRVFVVLHLSGSHGPSYHEKYPPEFERYQPTCKTVMLKECNPQELQNAYDNTIAYTDHVLARLSQVLTSIDANSAWLYLSDHGESLGESGLFLHGTPATLAPKEQINIPLQLWFSPQFQRSFQGDLAKASRMVAVGQGHVFHTVMGLLSLHGGPYRVDLDLTKELN
jgi:lipid A ethanolaminephosphotransferase